MALRQETKSLKWDAINVTNKDNMLECMLDQIKYYLKQTKTWAKKYIFKVGKSPSGPLCNEEILWKNFRKNGRPIICRIT